MWAPAGPLAQLFCWLLLAVSQTFGVVTAPSSVTVGVDQPLNLSCSITTSTNHTIHQVIWLDKHKRPLLVYTPGSPLHVSKQEPNVQLGPSHPGVSHITISALRPEDEGCFLCIFHVYPGGQQQGQTCVTVTGTVKHRNHTNAEVGKAAVLTCSYTLPAEVLQVLWRKMEQGNSSTMASSSSTMASSSSTMASSSSTMASSSSTMASSSRYEQRVQIHPGFSKRGTLNTDVGHSELRIEEVNMEDEACYSCEFHTYPHGTKSARTCLAVYVLPKPAVNYVTVPSDAIEANCSARSKPSAQITWDFGGDNRTLGPPVFSSFNHSDGTTTVTSTVLFKSPILSDVKCTIHHLELDKPLVVSLMNEAPALVILLTVCGVAAMLLLCLCGCLCKYFVCNNDRSLETGTRTHTPQFI
ncbi:uncharacterized protein [Eucyclogobius newberryi]|uniref:uncharacterized protein n=1 Tax=Eucyclogobius newberryi TaxID=166745 RepID=UPI003B5919A5